MKFQVLITADASVSTLVDVEATTPEEANALALIEARDSPDAFNWTLDDGNTPADPRVSAEAEEVTQ